MKKIRLFFSIVVIILIILSIFIYIFLNNFEKEKIISDIEKKFEIKINEKNKTKINIFPIVKLNTNLEIKDYKNNLYFDNIRIDISQPVFQVSGNLDILIDNFNIKQSFKALCDLIFTFLNLEYLLSISIKPIIGTTLFL